MGGRHGRGLDGSKRSDSEKNNFGTASSMVIVVSSYQAAWAGADHRDYPGLVLARGWKLVVILKAAYTKITT
jgi:hypothetical protein